MFCCSYRHVGTGATPAGPRKLPWQEDAGLQAADLFEFLQIAPTIHQLDGPHGSETEPELFPRKELGAQPLFNREGKVNLQRVAQMVLVVQWLEMMCEGSLVGQTGM